MATKATPAATESAQETTILTVAPASTRFMLEGVTTLSQGDNNDLIYGGDGNDFISEEGTGVSGADFTNTANYLIGEGGDDTLIGSFVGDFFEGGIGNDGMTAGPEFLGVYMDIFCFHSGSGQDTITDFAPGIDRIMIQSNVNGSAIFTSADAWLL